MQLTFSIPSGGYVFPGHADSTGHRLVLPGVCAPEPRVRLAFLRPHYCGGVAVRLVGSSRCAAR